MPSVATIPAPIAHGCQVGLGFACLLVGIQGAAPLFYAVLVAEQRVVVVIVKGGASW